MIIRNGNWKVYIHINKINNKMYVGITSRDVNKRWKNGRGYTYNVHFYNAIQKYGWNNFEHVIFADNLTECEAKNIERILIKKLNLTNYKYGYNNDDGGGMPPILKGESNPFYNKIPYKAVEASVKSRTGKHLTNEHKDKISQGCLNKNGKQVLCVELNIIYPSLGEIERQLGINHSAIIYAIKHETKSKGYHWKYLV